MARSDRQICKVRADSFCVLRLHAHWLSWNNFRPGDRVRVTVKRLQPPKRKEKG
jgi:hypothetical protein